MSDSNLLRRVQVFIGQEASEALDELKRLSLPEKVSGKQIIERALIQMLRYWDSNFPVPPKRSNGGAVVRTGHCKDQATDCRKDSCFCSCDGCVEVGPRFVETEAALGADRRAVGDLVSEAFEAMGHKVVDVTPRERGLISDRGKGVIDPFAASLDAVGPTIESGRGKASVETVTNPTLHKLLAPGSGPLARSKVQPIPKPKR